MNTKLKIFLFNSLILVTSSIFFKSLAIFFTGFITKKIGTEILGIFNLVMSVYSLGITLATFGINFAITRLVSEELALNNKEGIKKVSNSCILISLICGLITDIIFIILSDFIIKHCIHNKVNKNIMYLICIALPFISMSSAISGYFVAVRRVYKSTIAQFFEQIVKVLITVLLLKLFLQNRLEYACFLLILGDLISEIISFLCNYILYKNDLKIYKTSYITHLKLSYYNKKILKLATPVAITSLIRSGLSTLKQVIIPLSFEKGMQNCSKALSIYGEINGMTMPIILFPNIIFSSISSLLIPEFSIYKTQNKKNLIKKITEIILVISISASILICFLLFTFSSNLGKSIYNNTNISYYIRILSPLAFFVLLDCVIDNILKGLDAQNEVMIINIIDTLIDIFLIYFTVPKFNISGYIFSIYASEILNFILSFCVLIKYVFNKKRGF